MDDTPGAIVGRESLRPECSLPTASYPWSWRKPAVRIALKKACIGALGALPTKGLETSGNRLWSLGRIKSIFSVPPLRPAGTAGAAGGNRQRPAPPGVRPMVRHEHGPMPCYSADKEPVKGRAAEGRQRAAKRGLAARAAPTAWARRNSAPGTSWMAWSLTGSTRSAGLHTAAGHPAKYSGS